MLAAGTCCSELLFERESVVSRPAMRNDRLAREAQMRRGKGRRNDAADDTRRLLRTFGVSVTDFERESEELLERIRALGEEPGEELVAELRDLLELIADSNAKWQKVTEQLFETQRRVLADVVQALPR